MKTIDKIQKLYYDTFHQDGIPLEFGTEVIYSYGLETDKGIITTTDIKETDCFSVDTIAYYDCIYKNDIIEIIGKPISITMLLRLLADKLVGYGDMSIGIDKQYLYIRVYRPIKEVIELDLSKGDLLRDQDEEVIIKIAELLDIK